jgi:hypothetical protein
VQARGGDDDAVGSAWKGGGILCSQPLASQELASQELASQELDENCTVSILNRTTRVLPDGTWRIDNVPANFGRVRARFTCTRDGRSLSGQSEFFTIEENIVNGFNPDVEIGAAQPVPASLQVSAPDTLLTSTQRTTRLEVTALYADGRSEDRTDGSSGTNYTVSNAAIARVDADGRVTGLASGTVLISAMNEGALGMLRVQVVLSGDADGDGLADDVEVRLGLDPADPADALEDADGDGLASGTEVGQLGTDPINADTDADGINDGEEVVPGADNFITNPLVRDTDTDGIGDGLELDTQSDPTDPASFNLAQALTGLTVEPSLASLTVNAFTGLAEQQLAVQGILRDGASIDLSATGRGTNYTSDDLTVCNFGVPDGRIFAGQAGRCTIQIENNGFNTQAEITVQDFTPNGLAFLALPGYANNVDVANNIAYVAAGAAGLQVIDVSNPRNPRITAALDLPGNANDIRQANGLGYVAAGDSGLQIVELTNVNGLTLAGAVDTPGQAQDLAIAGNRIYVADGVAGLQIVDASDPANPQILGTADTPGTARGVATADGLVLIADGSPSSALRVIDISDPTSPQIVGAVDIPGDAKDLVVRQGIAYVAAFTGGLQIVDFSTPSAPQIVGQIPGSGAEGFIPRDLALEGNFILAAEQLFPNAVPFVAVDDPAAPLFRGILDFSPLGDYAGTGIALDGPFVYMTGEFFVVRNDNVSEGTTGLFVGQFRPFVDRGEQAPSVRITAPVSGETLIEESLLSIAIDAADDVAVATVELEVNGEIIATDATAPYSFRFQVPADITELDIEVRAIDFGNNVGRATPVRAAVIPDPLTTVVGRVINETGSAQTGILVSVGDLTTVSDGAGNFTLAQVPTVAGRIDVTVTGVVDGIRQFGAIGALVPVRGGQTNVGDIVLRATPLYPGRKVFTGNAPSDVELIDINRDGDVDLLTANAASHDVSLSLGNGDGTFQTLQRFSVGQSPVEMALGDLDGDGELDVVTANENGDNVSVLLGHGDGTFREQLTVPAGDGTHSVALGDVDLDGNVDVVLVNVWPSEMVVFLGDGAGGLIEHQRFRQS